MRFNVKIPLPFKKRRPPPPPEEGEGEEEREDLIVSRRPPEEVMGERYKKSPATIFVGSSKGGTGKSFIASALAYVAAAHTKRKVYAVDLDLDNTTLTDRVLTKEKYRLINLMVQSRNIYYLNVADVLDEGLVKGQHILVISENTFTCGGSQVKVTLRLVPPYFFPDRKRQEIRLRELDALRLREGITSLVDYVKSKGGIAIFDGKQKSNMGIDYDPLYRVMKEKSDVVLLVTEPPYLSFSSITAQYRDILDRVVIVVNKMEHGAFTQFKLLVEDALRYEVPVFMIPYNEEDRLIYDSRDRVTPALHRLDRGSIKFVGALAMYLNLVEDCTTGCCSVYGGILERYLRLVRALGE